MRAIHLLMCFLVQSNFQLLQASRAGRPYFSCFGLLDDTSRRKFSPSQMPLAPLFECYTVWYHILPNTNSKRGRHDHFFFTGTRIGASRENVSPPTTDHQKGQKRSGVRFRMKKLCFPPICCLNEETAGSTPRHVMSVKIFMQTLEDLTCLMLNINWNITQNSIIH